MHALGLRAPVDLGTVEGCEEAQALAVLVHEVHVLIAHLWVAVGRGLRQWHAGSLGGAVPDSCIGLLVVPGVPACLVHPL